MRTPDLCLYDYVTWIFVTVLPTWKSTCICRYWCFTWKSILGYLRAICCYWRFTWKSTLGSMSHIHLEVGERTYNVYILEVLDSEALNFLRTVHLAFIIRSIHGSLWVICRSCRKNISFNCCINQYLIGLIECIEVPTIIFIFALILFVKSIFGVPLLTVFKEAWLASLTSETTSMCSRWQMQSEHSWVKMWQS